MDITSNYFKVFGLPVEYDIDLEQLSERYRDLQRQFHPDRHVAKTARERRLSEQYTTFINQAYVALKSPLLRAQYLLGIMGIEQDDEVPRALEPDFLMEQMSLRETLAEVRDAEDPAASLQEVSDQVTGHCASLQRQFSEQFRHADVHNATDTVAKMQFFYKLLKEVEQLEQELDDY